MLVTTKYSIGDSIWFLANASLQCGEITVIELMSNAEETKTVYIVPVSLVNGQPPLNVMVREGDAFASKDELIQTITQRFYDNVGTGSA